MLLQHEEPEEIGHLAYTIGVCTSGEDRPLPALLRGIRAMNTGRWRLKNVIIVASEPSQYTNSILKEVSNDNRFRIIIEEKRRGKWEAINRILESCKTEYLVLVNGDALPMKGAIEGLLDKLDSDRMLAVVSSLPLVPYKGGIASGIVALMWEAHNEALRLLSREGSNSHSCDELMAVRKSMISKLPEGTVNDGGFMSCSAFIKGYRVSYSPSSIVLVATPKRLADVVRQRRRISYGHMQVWRSVGKPPSTIESIVITRPLVALSILGNIIRRRPRLLLSLFPALVEEAFSYSMALWDASISSARHVVWRRYES